MLIKKLYLLLLAGSFTTLFAQSVAHNRCARFAKGMNLSNWLEATWQTNYPTPNGYTRSDLLNMKEAGITSIRLPVCFAFITDSVAPYTVNENHALFERIDTVISWCRELDMMLIIDNHHEWDIYNYNWRNKIDRFAHLWSVVSQRYNYLDPEQFSFELLNEPGYGIALDSLNIVLNNAIDTVRKYAPHHSIIVSPNFAGSGQAFANLQPLSDTNLIYTWHTYDPYQFTHQGFSWAQPSMPLGTPFPSSYDAMLYNAWKQVINWRNTYNKPVFLGEFGTGIFGDDVSRCNWIELNGAKIDSFSMPWFYWDWRWDFSMFNSHVVSHDSVIPCFKHALHLYGDTLTATPIVFDVAFSISVYPNPVVEGGICEVKANSNEALSVALFDVSGRKLSEARFTEHVYLFLEEFHRGIYFIRISSKEHSVTRKLVLE
jgi:endoglucanase